MPVLPKQLWVRCPSCGNKTRIKVYEDTVLLNFLSRYERRKSVSSRRAHASHYIAVSSNDPKNEEKGHG